jgi:pilus assembly protein Flp/PilA
MLNKFLSTKLEKGSSMIEYVWVVAMSRFLCIKSQKGVTMIEYALIAALVAVVAIAALTLVGTNLNLVFNKVSNKLR